MVIVMTGLTPAAYVEALALTLTCSAGGLHSAGAAGAEDDAAGDTGADDAGLLDAGVDAGVDADLLGAGDDDFGAGELDDLPLAFGVELDEDLLGVFLPPPGAHFAARKISTSTPNTTARRRRQ
jgi:hypothetical protein